MSGTEVAPWQAPLRARYPDRALFDQPGVEQLRAFVSGRAPSPPIHYLTGMKPTDVGLGTSAFSMPASEWLLAPQGLISVGTLAVLADGPLGCAIQSALPPRTAYATSELSLRLLRPARSGGTLIARGALVHAGRSIGLSTVQIFDGDGHLLADGSSLCFIRPPTADVAALPAAPPPPPAEPDGDSPRPYQRPVRGEVLGQDVWDRMSGLEVLEGQLSGELPKPPIHFLTGARPIEARAGEAVFAMPCHEWLCSPLGTVEGGTIAMLADDALTSAIQTMLPPRTALGSIDLKVNFLRPVPPDGRELVARGRVRHSGRSIAVAEAEVLNADNKTVALATGSAMVLAGRPAAIAVSD